MKFSEFIKTEELNEAPMGRMHRRRLAARRSARSSDTDTNTGTNSKEIEQIDKLISAFNYRLGLKTNAEYDDIIKYTNNPTWYNEKFKDEVIKLLDKSKDKLKELEDKIKNQEKTNKDYYQIPYWKTDLEKFKIRIKDLEEMTDTSKIHEKSLKNLAKKLDSYVDDIQKLLKTLESYKPKFKSLSAAQLVSLERYFMNNSSDVRGSEDCIKRIISIVKESFEKIKG